MAKIGGTLSSAEKKNSKTDAVAPVVQPQIAVPNCSSILPPELKAAGFIVTLPVGLYCLTSKPRPGALQNGGLPAVYIQPLRDRPEYINISGVPQRGWLSAIGDSVSILISHPSGRAFMTIYQVTETSESAAALEVRQLPATIREASTRSSNALPAAAPAADTRECKADVVQVDILAHVHGHGHVGASFGGWLGVRRSRNLIEGFAIAAPAGIRPADLSYQAMLGSGCLSSWVEAGTYCGSHNTPVPLLGFRIRLQGKVKDSYDLAYRASFVDGSLCGPVSDGDICESDSLSPLEALQIILTPKLGVSGSGRH